MIVTIALLVATVLANVGPKTTVSLIPRTQIVNNTKGSSLETRYWVLTEDDPDNEDKGIAHINFDTTLTMNGVEDGSKLYWCALIMKVAGTSVSYDCGLCSHTLNRELDGIGSPNEEQRLEWESRWSLTDQYFNSPPFAQTPTVSALIANSRDRLQDWEWRDEMDFATELVPDTKIVVLKCPIKRLMNT